MQRFLRFKAAVNFVSKSSSGDEEAKKLSDQLGSSLSSLANLIRRVVSNINCGLYYE